MQAGHRKLYVTPEEKERLIVSGNRLNHYVDVAKLIDQYRMQVNPKANVFSVRTAGYNNVVIPENGYRTALFTDGPGKN